MLDDQAGVRPGGIRPATRRPGLGGYHGWPTGTQDGVQLSYDAGYASRFFFVAKAARSERDAGLPTARFPKGSTHPTVKAVALMRWLCRLVTPPRGLILDPFAGSGSTLVAACQEGFMAIGIEREAEYAEIARSQCAHIVAPQVLDWTP